MNLLLIVIVTILVVWLLFSITALWFDKTYIIYHAASVILLILALVAIDLALNIGSA